jgi:DNA adenine methylase
VQNHLEEFARQFQWAFTSRQVFRWLQDTRPETLTDIQRAARFYYLQHHAFGGKVADQHFGTATTNSAPINLSRIEKTLLAARQRLSTVVLENLPWQDCLRRYDRSHTFFYADPPYWKTEGYGVPFGIEQYEQLAEFMRTCAGRVMLSINDHPDIRSTFPDFIVHETGIRYNLASDTECRKNEVTELVITNYEPCAGELFQQ